MASTETIDVLMHGHERLTAAYLLRGAGATAVGSAAILRPLSAVAVAGVALLAANLTGNRSPGARDPPRADPWVLGLVGGGQAGVAADGRSEAALSC